jgi:hypothetical protein
VIQEVERIKEVPVELKSFLTTSYKNSSPRTAKASRDIRLPGAIDPQDHHYSIEMERKKMASTF